MGLEFITRVIRTSAITGLVVALCLALYYDWKFALGFLTGLAWSLVNLFFIRQLIAEVISPGKTVRKNLAAAFAIIKFPLLYVAGYFIIASGWFSIYALLIGFSFMFVIIVLKVLGRLVLGLDLPGLKHNHAEGTRP